MEIFLTIYVRKISKWDLPVKEVIHQLLKGSALYVAMTVNNSSDHLVISIYDHSHSIIVMYLFGNRIVKPMSSTFDCAVIF
jgi:hypothetical protein